MVRMKERDGGGRGERKGGGKAGRESGKEKAGGGKHGRDGKETAEDGNLKDDRDGVRVRKHALVLVLHANVVQEPHHDRLKSPVPHEGDGLRG